MIIMLWNIKRQPPCSEDLSVKLEDPQKKGHLNMFPVRSAPWHHGLAHPCASHWVPRTVNPGRWNPTVRQQGPWVHRLSFFWGENCHPLKLKMWKNINSLDKGFSTNKTLQPQVSVGGKKSSNRLGGSVSILISRLWYIMIYPMSYGVLGFAHQLQLHHRFHRWIHFGIDPSILICNAIDTVTFKWWCDG